MSEILRRPSLAVNFTRSLTPGLINYIRSYKQWRSWDFWRPVGVFGMADRHKN